jgi:hypothetical protein
MYIWLYVCSSLCLSVSVSICLSIYHWFSVILILIIFIFCKYIYSLNIISLKSTNPCFGSKLLHLMYRNKKKNI